MSSDRARLDAGATQLGLTLDPLARERLSRYLQALLEWSSRLSLTALRGPEQLVRDGFLDALSCLALIPPGTARIVDVGSGAGFPAIPIAIVYPQAVFTLVEATRRKVTFLRHVVRTLGLPHVAIIHGRAEVIARAAAHAGSYDLGLARAAATPTAQASLVRPFLRADGLFLAQVSRAAGAALREPARLGFSLERVVPSPLHAAREIVVLRAR